MTHFDVATAIPDWGVWGSLRHVLETPIQGFDNRGIDVTLPPYNAKGDGVTDDTSAIQAPLNDGAPIFLPAGKTFLVSLASNGRCLNLPSGARIFGEGTIKMAAGQAASTRLLATVVGASGIVIDGATLDGNKASQSAGEQWHALFVDGASDVEVRNVRIKDPKGDCVLINESSDVRIKNSRLSGPSRNGVTLYNSVDEVAIEGCRIWDVAAQPIDSEPNAAAAPTNVRVEDCDISASADYSIAVGGLSTDPTSGWQIVGNRITGSLYVVYAADVLIENNIIEGVNGSSQGGCIWGGFTVDGITVKGNLLRGASSSTIDHLVRFVMSLGAYTSNLIFEGNRVVMRGTSRGMDVWGVDGYQIENNVFQAESGVDTSALYLRDTAAIRNGVVVGNTFRHASALTTYGTVYVHGAGAGFENLMIGHNVFDLTANYGVEFVAAGTYTKVTVGTNVYGSNVTIPVRNDPTV